MKFSLFVHMERISPQQSHKELYQEMVDLCEMADNGGFHAIWTGEHHGMDFTIAPNPLINIADLARRIADEYTARDGRPRGLDGVSRGFARRVNARGIPEELKRGL